MIIKNKQTNKKNRVSQYHDTLCKTIQKPLNKLKDMMRLMCDVYVLTDMKLDINLKYIFLINNNMLKINTTDK